MKLESLPDIHSLSSKSFPVISRQSSNVDQVITSMRKSVLKATIVFGVIIGVSNAAQAGCNVKLHIVNTCLGTAKGMVGAGSDVSDQANNNLAKDIQSGACSGDDVITIKRVSLDAGAKAVKELIASPVKSMSVVQTSCINSSSSY